MKQSKEALVRDYELKRIRAKERGIRGQKIKEAWASVKTPILNWRRSSDIS
jgi:hypothetical protein